MNRFRATIVVFALLLKPSPVAPMDLQREAPAIVQNAKATVRHLAHVIGPRNLLHPDSLRRSAEFIKGKLQSYGYEVETQVVAVGAQETKNLIAQKTGSKRPEEIIVVGAHYDTVPSTPGADDNASGVAGLLELARLFSSEDSRRTLVFAAFCLEEPPFFKTETMGSMVYAKALKDKGVNVKVMVSLEMIGFFDKTRRQHFPLPLMGLFYPKSADFIGVVGNLRSRRLVTTVSKAMRQGGKIGVESLSTVSFVPGVDFSDHVSFWKHDYPALMITDTAFYRNPHYHGPTDTVETLNFESLAEVVQGLCSAIKALDQE